MKKYLLPILLIAFWSCEEKKQEEVDTEKPTVTISSPQNGSSVYEIATITCMSSDNEGVEKVELWVNGVTTGLTDDSEPYSFDWNTTTLEDGGYTIIVRSYDTSDNTTDSEPVVLTIDNTLSIPTPVELYPITYNDGLQISWSQNNDDDFQSYKLYESLSEDMSSQTLVYETEDRTDTTYLITIEVLKYYRILVEDSWGFQSISNIEIGDYYFEFWGVVYSVLNTTSLILYNLTGSIPPEIGYLTNLTFLSINGSSNGKLTGSIPSEIGNLTNLSRLNFSGNQLTGSIPSEIGNLTNLIELYISDNQLTGLIPSEIGNLTNLTHLYLPINDLTGSIPSEIGNLTNLTSLNLQDNQLTGEIPESICNLVENNCSINIYYNQLCPPYPSCIEDYVGTQDTSDCD